MRQLPTVDELTSLAQIAEARHANLCDDEEVRALLHEALQSDDTLARVAKDYAKDPTHTDAVLQTLRTRSLAKLLDAFQAVLQRRAAMQAADGAEEVAPGWYLTVDGVHEEVRARGGSKLVRALPGPLRLTGRLDHVTDQTALLALAWATGRLAVPRDEALSATGLTKVSKQAGFPVNSSNAPDAVRYLLDVEQHQEQRGTLRTARLTDVLGWTPKRDGFVLGADLVTAEGVGPAQVDIANPATWSPDAIHHQPPTGHQVADAYGCRGTFEGWRSAVVWMLNVSPAAQFALAATLAAPLLSLLGVREGFVADLACTTSRGKTHALELAASAWGSPAKEDGLVRGWNATKVGPEAVFHQAQHAPVFFDDSKTRGDTDVATVVYDLAAGAGKVRAAPGRAQLQAPLTWRTCMLSTGEAPLSAYFDRSSGGAYARVLTYARPPLAKTPANATRLEAMSRAIRENYGHAARVWLQSLMVRREEWSAWRTRLVELTAEWRQRAAAVGVSDSVELRKTAVVALVDFTAQLAAEALHVPLPKAGAAALDALKSGSTETDRALAALESLWAVIDSNRSRFRTRRGADGEPHGGWWGRWDNNDTDEPDDRVFVATDRAKTLLAECGYRWEEIRDEWRDRGWLLHQEGRHDYSVRVGKGRKASRHVALLLPEIEMALAFDDALEEPEELAS